MAEYREQIMQAGKNLARAEMDKARLQGELDLARERIQGEEAGALGGHRRRREEREGVERTRRRRLWLAISLRPCPSSP